jgi:hypothetical protein
MQFHNRAIVAPLLVSLLLIAVSVFAYEMGRTYAERRLYDSQIGQGAPMRLAGGIIGTWGGERIFYTTYCGSSCLGFTVQNLTTGKKQEGSLGFMYDDDGDAYTLFEDWNGETFRFDGEFISVSGREHGEKHILDFSVKEKEVSEPVVHSMEF